MIYIGDIYRANPANCIADIDVTLPAANVIKSLMHNKHLRTLLIASETASIWKELQTAEEKCKTKQVLYSSTLS